MCKAAVNKSVTMNEKPFVCKVCKKEFFKKLSFKMHLRTHSEKRYECNVCNTKFSQLSYLMKHARIHIGEKPYACEICNKGFLSNTKLKRHLLTHTGEKPFECAEENCRKKFACNWSLQKHTLAHKKAKLRMSLAMYNKSQRKCKECGKGFDYPSKLKKHYRVHCKEKPFEGGKKFAQSSCVKRHELIHKMDAMRRRCFAHVDIPDEGKVCMTLPYNESLTYEEGYAPPVECEICSRLFSHEALSFHRRTHAGEKPYECEVCRKKFSKKPALQKHALSHKEDKLDTNLRTPDPPLKCEVCGKVFLRLSHLARHSNVHNEYRLFERSDYKKRFTRNSDLKGLPLTLKVEVRKKV